MEKETDVFEMFAGLSSMHAKFRTRDWASTAIGDPKNWSLALLSAVSLMLDSKFPMFVVWGPRLTFLYNESYASLMDLKHPTALGQSLDVILPDLWGDIHPLIKKALAGQPTYSEDVLRTVRRNGDEQRAWFTLSYSPVRDDAGIVAGALCIINETTAKVLLETRQALHQDLVERFRNLSSVDSMVAVASELLGFYLNASHVIYAEVDESKNCFENRQNWARSGLNWSSEHFGPSVNYSPKAIASLRAGIPLSIVDIKNDIRATVFCSDDEETSARAALIVPLVKNDTLVATFTVFNLKPRHWDESDLQVAADITERTWNAVERVRIDTALRTSMAKQKKMLAIGEFQLRVADALRRPDDPE